MIGVSRNTVDKLLRDLGTVCSEYQDKVLVNLPCRRVQVSWFSVNWNSDWSALAS